MNRTALRLPIRSWLLAAIFALGCDSNADGLPPSSPGGAGAGAGGAGAAAAGAPPGPGGAPGSNPGAGGSPAPGNLAGSGGSGGSGGSPGSLDGPPSPGPDAAVGVPAPGRRPRPGRFIVLGDSIAACSNIGNEDGPECSLKKLHDYLKSRHAPSVVYENEAVGAAVTGDVPAQQLGEIEDRPGHALVLVYVGGNDLAKYMFSLDAIAEQGLATDLPRVLAAWKEIFAHFEDRTRYPDGFTMIMNNQYNPFDDCTAPPYFLTAKKSQLLAMFNAALTRLAQEKGAQITDQYTPFLGHGHHYQVRTCPHFKADATPFMDDLIHPNAAGHENLFQQWKALVDRLYN